MIPGRTLKPEDALQIVRRRRLQIFLPFLLVSLAAAAIIHKLPDRYRSETLILIVPQRVPESYVRSTVTTRIEDRLRSIGQQIMSRTRLEPVIREFNLYPDIVKTGLMEDVIEKMRSDIDVQIVRGDAFHISYVSNDPRTAMKVTERLASMYIDENLRDREVLADGTNQFLESQLAAAKVQLLDHEKKLEEYNKRYAGQLPGQVQANLQVLQNAQLQIQALVDSISRDKDRRMTLEGLLADANVASATAAQVSTPGAAVAATQTAAPPAVDTPATDAAGSVSPAESAAVQLDGAVRVLHALQSRLKPEHPDVLRQQRFVAELRKKAEAEAIAAETAPRRPAGPVDNRAEIARAGRIAQTRAELDSLGQQIARKELEEERLRGVVTEYQGRVEAVPARESELTELTRDYDTLERSYTSLLSKKEDAQVSANLERYQIGEQFKILDPARMPEKPISPDRPRLYGLGAAIGLGLGLVLAVLLEFRDTTLKTDADVVAALTLPVLALIPELVTLEEQLARVRRRRLASWITAGTAALVALGVTWVLKF